MVTAASIDPRVSFLEAVDEHASIAGDVLQIDTNTWAIHGYVAVDGDVLLAEFATERAARDALAELGGFERTHRPAIPGTDDAAPSPR
jgi:hypothetical protein